MFLILSCFLNLNILLYILKGPAWLPVFGNLLQVMHLLKIYKFYHLVWLYLSEKYGNIVGLKLGSNKLVIVSGEKMIKEFYANECFDGRPDGFFFRMRTFNERLGIVFNDGHVWEEHRHFSMRTLKQLGLGKSNMVEHIEHEVCEMIQFYKKISHDGSPVKMENAFDISILNIIWAFISGKRFSLDDERLPELHKMIHDGFKVIDMSGGILNLFPAIRYVFPEMSGYRPLLRVLQPLWNFLTNTINEIKEENLCTENKSFISQFLNEMKNRVDDKNFKEKHLLALCIDLFQAGAETSSNTLAFGIIYLLRNPSVVTKMRRELDAVVGNERLPLLSDRPNLPFSEAVLYEILRMSTVAPLAIAHRTSQTTLLGKYVIPKDTLVMILLKALHMDKKYWIDPEQFRPERFLDKQGKFEQHDHFLPFGAGIFDTKRLINMFCVMTMILFAGKRRCIGENLAKSSIFLFLVSFIHAFDILLPSKADMPDVIGLDGITISPKPYKVFLKWRLP